MMQEADLKVADKMRDQMKVVEILIRDEIRASFPEYNLKIMEKVSEIGNSIRDQGLRNINRL